MLRNSVFVHLLMHVDVYMHITNMYVQMRNLLHEKPLTSSGLRQAYCRNHFYRVNSYEIPCRRGVGWLVVQVYSVLVVCFTLSPLEFYSCLYTYDIFMNHFSVWYNFPLDMPYSALSFSVSSWKIKLIDFSRMTS